MRDDEDDDSQEAVRSPSMHSYDAGVAADNAKEVEEDDTSYVSLKMQSNQSCKRQKRSEMPNLI